MTEEEIKTTIVELLTQSLAGQEIERNKIDFKYEWYDLTDIKGINEFLKDTTSIANSVGPGGFIAIGFDEKGKRFKDSKFEDCKLRDYSDISGIFAKRLSNIINTEFITLNMEPIN